MRTAIHLLLTYLRRRIAKRALRCSAPAVWNSLPKTVLSSDSVAAFLVQAKDIPLLPGLLFFLCSLTRCLAPARVTSWRYTNVFTIPPQICELSIVMSVSVCLCVCVFVRDYIFGTTRPIFKHFVHVTYGRGSVLLWRCSDTLCTSGFVDDVIFEMSQGCSRSPPS